MKTASNAQIAVSRLEHRVEFGGVSFVERDRGATYSIIRNDLRQAVLHEYLERTILELEEGAKDAVPRAGIVRLGRGEISPLKIQGNEFVLRKYLRGGFVSKLVKRRFFMPVWKTLEQSRPVQEVSVLADLKALGLPVASPVGLFIRFCWMRFFYEAYLLMEKIPDAANLLEIAVAQETKDEELSRLCFEAGRVARRILDAGIFHSDLHLGNVLVSSGNIFIIDFDKATRCDQKQFKACGKKLLSRWKRSAEKHKVAPCAVIAFQDGFQVAGSVE